MVEHLPGVRLGRSGEARSQEQEAPRRGNQAKVRAVPREAYSREADDLRHGMAPTSSGNVGQTPLLHQGGGGLEPGESRRAAQDLRSGV